MMYAPSRNVAMAITVAEIIYGLSSRRKLMPDDSMAIISELSASLEVKNITAMNTNSGENWLAK